MLWGRMIDAPKVKIRGGGEVTADAPEQRAGSGEGPGGAPQDESGGEGLGCQGI